MRALVLISVSVVALLATIETKAEFEVTSVTEKFDVLFGGIDVGDMTVIRNQNALSVDFGFSNNGRGASSEETLTISDKGFPLRWQITGKTVFGNAVSEQFSVSDGKASWQDAAGKGSAEFDNDAIYVAQDAGPYALYLYAKALLNDNDQRVNALPGGVLEIEQVATEMLSAADGVDKQALIYAVSGIALDPSYLAMDKNHKLIAVMSPRFSVIQQSLVAHDKQLRDLAADLNATRFETIANESTYDFDKPVRINNVRIFDPKSLSLTEAKSVVIVDNQISAIESVVDQPSQNEVVIQGNGGTLVPGLFEMHGHMSDNDALLNVLAGVTSVRDMGNEIEVLDPLISKIESGQLIGPRITKSAFIEGESEFANATGEKASTEQEAVDLVKMYAERGGYHQIKIYSSIRGEWVPAMAKEAKKHGMRVAGHIPAFAKVNEMIAAGYDEITHINQVMLSWVLDRDEDTRTLFRITGMKRFVDVDLDSDTVSKTLNLMIENDIAVDPTIVIHEFGLTARNGETRIGMRDYIDHMPVGVQRSAKQALLNVADEAEDMAYLKAFDKVLDTLSLMHEKGIFIVPGTDLGGAFELHRELELFKRIGMSNAEVLRRGSYDMAQYLGYGDQLGSVEVGKKADFFMVPGNPVEDLKAIKKIALVAKDGKVFFPSEIYPYFGIKPFTEVPKMTGAE